MALLLKRLAIAVAVFIVGGGAVLVAIFFLFAALYLWFGEFLAPPLAALATAGVLLGFAGFVVILGAIASAVLRRKPRRDFSWFLELLEAPDGLSAVAIGNLIGRRLQAFARKNAPATIIASLLAGLALGISPGLRSLLRDLLKD
ncbi:MAG: hypothetical protein ACLQUZ_16040 [Rhizomicrobium sp.]